METEVNRSETEPNPVRTEPLAALSLSQPPAGSGRMETSGPLPARASAAGAAVRHFHREKTP